MRKAIFNNRFGDTITIDETLAPINICSELTLAVDEDVDNSGCIEAICGEEVAEQYREASTRTIVTRHETSSIPPFSPRSKP